MATNPNRVILKAEHIDKNVLEMAQERVARAFDLFDHPIVSFSGGKDSTVCLNLALAEARKRGRRLHVMHFDEEAIPYETEEYVRRVSQTEDIDFDWLCLPIAHRNSCSSESTMWYPWAPEAEHLWVRPLPPEGKSWKDVPEMPCEPVESRIGIAGSNPILYPARKYGSVCFIMGIRADESVRRRQAVTRKIADNFIMDQGKGQALVYPIYDWSTKDVWRAPKVFGWDYNRAYDLMELAGIGHHLQRIAPPYGEQPMQSLWMFKECFPDVWDKMADRVPGASTAARYARGALYGAGQGAINESDLAENESWEMRIMSVLEKYPDEQKRWVTNHILHFIERHYKKTTDPILVRPHPVTGVGWRLLYKVAEKGDFKLRAVPRLTTGEGKVRTTMVRQYKEAISKEQSDEPKKTAD